MRASAQQFTRSTAPALDIRSTALKFQSSHANKFLKRSPNHHFCHHHLNHDDDDEQVHKSNPVRQCDQVPKERCHQVPQQVQVVLPSLSWLSSSFIIINQMPKEHCYKVIVIIITTISSSLSRFKSASMSLNKSAPTFLSRYIFGHHAEGKHCLKH